MSKPAHEPVLLPQLAPEVLFFSCFDEVPLVGKLNQRLDPSEEGAHISSAGGFINWKSHLARLA